MTSSFRFGLIVPVTLAVLGSSAVLAVGCSGDESADAAGTGAGGGGGDIGLDAGAGTGGGGMIGVPETCEQAIAQQSYIGCEYWPTVTINSSLYEGFEFAIAASNPTKVSATITVERDGAVVTEVAIEPGQLQTIKLPWVAELKQTDPLGNGINLKSAIVKGGAYKVTSTVPITLYQFNPLEFQLDPPPADCPNVDPTGCFSFTNDASLVLPKTALRGEYYAMSYPTLHTRYGMINWVDLPGFVTVTATEDGTVVDVRSSAHVRSGTGVDALAPGGQASYQLDAGDVLMLLTAPAPPMETPVGDKECELDVSGVLVCPSSPEYDLTGTHIQASKPVAVIGGHDCTFIPYNRFACDHIEEALFPVEALGQDLIVTAPQAAGFMVETPDNMYVRVLSAADENTVTFDPPVSEPVMLNAGEWVEIGPIKKDFRVHSKDRIMVGQYMVGEKFSGASSGEGDPSLSIAIPTEQYRVSYSFLAPESYTHNFVNVVVPAGGSILIDGVAIDPAEFVEIGETGMLVARHPIEGGAHFIEGDRNFGIVTYGYGSYTSYMYPGGLNLETVIISPD